MAKKEKQYAQVLVASLKDVPEEEARRRAAKFKALLKRRGDLKLLGGILREFKKAWQERRGKLASLFFAKPLPQETKESIRQALLQQGYRVQEQVREELMGGCAVLLDNSTLIDNSVKGKLKKIAEITNHKSQITNKSQ